MSDPHPVAVHQGRRLALLSNDEIIPISSFYDPDGVECEPGEAAGFVAGPTAAGRWLFHTYEGFEPAPTH